MLMLTEWEKQNLDQNLVNLSESSQFGCDDLFHGEDDPVLAPERDGRAGVLHRLGRVVHLGMERIKG